MEDKQLVELAFQAQKLAYIPYSGFMVGAALLAADGRVFTGCNIESVSFSPTNCAERTAFFKAVSEGCHEFTKIAIVGGFADGRPSGDGYTAPCGVCRQVMAEFCHPDRFKIILAKSIDEPFREYSLRELLPVGFTPGHLA